MEGGANVLSEAIVDGVPVVATHAGWSPHVIVDGENGYLADTPGTLADAMLSIAAERETWFARRGSIQKTVDGWSLESWIRENLELAALLAQGAAGDASRRVEPAGAVA